MDRIAATLNKQWEGNRCSEDLSKDDRHVPAVMLGLRSARTVMHVLYDQVEKRLNHRLDSPPPSVIEAATLKQRQELDQVRKQQ